ncbi:hypothetical protein SteCoe_9163 [Stentor coeruleus]|uniref:Uncharacterized protein n=1 Tax=Stentor coeruleus TaxID=5963 RepID=A0A1R2CIT0_9CILI|nr:hypothetical protein SteCoe_9163 [Stentor coeruleus]
MQKNIRVYLIKPLKKPPKPFLPLIGSNLIRIIIEFLAYNDFIELCLSCKKLQKFFTDKYIKFQVRIPRRLISSNNETIASIHESYLINILIQGGFFSTNSEWKHYQINYFHYVVYDSHKYVFIYHENTFDIKELVEFSPELPTVSIKEFGKKIIKADGYSNKILLGFEDEVKLLVLDLKNEILNDNSDKNEEWCFRYPDDYEGIMYLFIFNKGKNVLIGFTERVYLLNEHMEIIKTHNIKEFIKNSFNRKTVYFLHMPNKQSKSYLIYNKKIIWVFGINHEKINKIEVKHSINKIATSSVNNHPELVYNDWYGGVYLNQHELKIRCIGDFILFQGNLIYLEHKNSDKILVYDLVNGKKNYSFDIFPDCSTELISACPYKIFFKQNSILYLHSIITGMTRVIQSPFEELYQVNFINPLLVLTGKTRNIYGLVFIDFYRKSDTPYMDVLQKYLARFES